MSGEYQLRKDVDEIIDDIYDIDYNTLKVVKFKENSPLKQMGVHVDDEGNYTDVGTLDTILESLGLMDIDERVRELVIGDIDLSGYVKKSDLIDNSKYDIDLNLSVGLSGLDDTITIDMDIVDHIVNKRIDIGGNEDGD